MSRVDRWVAWMLTAGLALLLAACAPRSLVGRAKTAPPQNFVGAAGSPDHCHGRVVVAEVESLQRRAHEEWLEGGAVWVSDVVAFAIVASQRSPKLLLVHVVGHPRIRGRPLLLGDRVTFLLPDDWCASDLAFEQLGDPAFADSGPSHGAAPATTPDALPWIPPQVTVESALDRGRIQRIDLGPTRELACIGS